MDTVFRFSNLKSFILNAVYSKCTLAFPELGMKRELFINPNKTIKFIMSCMCSSIERRPRANRKMTEIMSPRTRPW